MRYSLLIGIPVVAFVAYASGSVSWAGSRSIVIQVLVLDATTLTPIPDAVIEIFEGPSLAHEGNSREIHKELKLADSKKLITDEFGRTQFEHRFFAAGTRSLFRDTGYVDTSKLWLRATAEGYRTTYIPVDRQSIRPRDIQDETPICVTIPVGKT